MATLLQKSQKPVTLIIKRAGQRVVKLKLQGAVDLLSNFREGTKVERMITHNLGKAIAGKRK